MILIQHFAPATTAQLFYHAHNFITINSIELWYNSNNISIKFDLRWKNRLWNGPLPRGTSYMVVCTIRRYGDTVTVWHAAPESDFRGWNCAVIMGTGFPFLQDINHCTIWIQRKKYNKVRYTLSHEIHFMFIKSSEWYVLYVLLHREMLEYTSNIIF